VSEFKPIGFMPSLGFFALPKPQLSCYRKDNEEFVLKEEVMDYFDIKETKLISLIRRHRILCEVDFYITKSSFLKLHEIYRKYRQEDIRCGQSRFPSIKYIKKELKT